MKVFSWLFQLAVLLITCAAFAMGFNATHNALMYMRSGNALAEATRLLEQAHAMFTAATVCGVIFVAIFLFRLLTAAK